MEVLEEHALLEACLLDISGLDLPIEEQ